MKGHITINTHYFEQGNVQVNFKKDYNDIQLSAATGKGIADEIEKIES